MVIDHSLQRSGSTVRFNDQLNLSQFPLDLGAKFVTLPIHFTAKYLYVWIGAKFHVHGSDRLHSVDALRLRKCFGILFLFCILTLCLECGIPDSLGV